MFNCFGTYQSNMSNKGVHAEDLYKIESAGEEESLWPLASYEEELRSPYSSLFKMAAEDEDAENEEAPLKGFVLYRSCDREAWISHIAVESKGRGLGKKLLRGFLSHLKRRGFQTVGLEVSERNIRALRLYNRFAFYDVGIRKSYYQNGDDAKVMKCRL